MTFAKIFENPTLGQICCIAGAENENSNPEIRAFCVPKNLGVCSTAVLFEDTDNGWDTRDKLFAELNLEKAEALAKPVIDMGNQFTECESDESEPKD